MSLQMWLSGSLLFIEGIFTFSDVIIVDLQLRREGKYAQEEATDRISHVRDLKKTLEDFKQKSRQGVPVFPFSPSITLNRSSYLKAARNAMNMIEIEMRIKERGGSFLSNSRWRKGFESAGQKRERGRKKASANHDWALNEAWRKRTRACRHN